MLVFTTGNPGSNPGGVIFFPVCALDVWGRVIRRETKMGSKHGTAKKDDDQ